jgi:hypothetical protein
MGMRMGGDDQVMMTKQDLDRFKKEIVSAVYAWLVMTKDGEKQLHGIYVAPDRVLPTKITMMIAELEKQKAAMRTEGGKAAINRSIVKLRLYAATHNMNPRALIDLATSPEEGRTQEVIPAVSMDFEE